MSIAYLKIYLTRMQIASNMPTVLLAIYLHGSPRTHYVRLLHLFLITSYIVHLTYILKLKALIQEFARYDHPFNSIPMALSASVSIKPTSPSVRTSLALAATMVSPSRPFVTSSSSSITCRPCQVQNYDRDIESILRQMKHKRILQQI